MKKIINNLVKWQNYLHYIFLSIFVYIWHSIPYNEVVEQYYLSNPIIGLFTLILWWSIGLLIGDTIIHAIFYIAPKPIRWRD